MEHLDHEISQLRAQLQRKEQERRRAQSFSNAPHRQVQPASQSLSPGQNAASRSSAVPRSAATSASNMTSTSQTGRHMSRAHSQQSKKARTSQHLAPIIPSNMTRSRSSLSTTSNPFAPSGPVTPPHLHTASQSMGMMGHFLTNDNLQPANAFVYGDSVMGRVAQSRQQPELESLVKGSSGLMDPADYLSSLGEEDFGHSPLATSPHTTSPIGINSKDRLLTPQDANCYSAQHIPSTCGSLTSGQTLETPMTRSSSNALDNMSITSQFDNLVRIHSTAGLSRQDSYEHAAAGTYGSTLGKRHSRDDELVGFGANMQQFSHPYASSAPAVSDLSQHLHAMERTQSLDSTRSNISLHGTSSVGDAASHYHHHLMKRSVSEGSTTSNHSGTATRGAGASIYPQVAMERSESMQSTKSNLSLRAKEALNRQNKNAAKASLLVPKPDTKPVKESPSNADHKAPKYERPKRPRVKCEQCDEYPEGFRGEHELRRHTEAKHRSMVKKWVCRDPATAGLPSTVIAINPLSKCKACAIGKQYGAYYNAAAHLRRTHFKVRSPRGKGGNVGKGSKSKVPMSTANSEVPKAEEEKRHGKGGGDWPLMNDLKNWMVEVSIPMSQADAFVIDGGDSVGQPEADTEMLDNAFMSPVEPNNSGFIQGPFDMTQDFVGMGGPFNNCSLDTVDTSFQSFHDISSQGTEVDRNDVAPTDTMYGSIPDVLISSANFSFGLTIDKQACHGPPPALMSLDGSTYTSPVSSTATITPGSAFPDPPHLSPVNMAAPQSDPGEFDFTMIFDSNDPNGPFS